MVMVMMMCHQCPSFDPMCDVQGPMQPLYSNKEMEQVVVFILLGKDLIKDWGSFLRKFCVHMSREG